MERRAWRLYIDESGDPDSDAPDERPVVAGVLLPRLASDLPLRHCFERAAPYWAWPHHACLTRHGALHALIARIRGRVPLALPFPLDEDAEGHVAAGDILAEALGGPFRRELSEFDASVERGRSPRVGTAHTLARAAMRLEPALVQHLNSAAAAAYEASVSGTLARMSTQSGQPLTLVAAISLVAPPPGGHYLALLEAALGVVRDALHALGGSHDIYVHVSERDIPAGGGPRRLEAADITGILSALPPSEKLRWAGAQAEPYYDPMAAAGYVAVDFAARKVRRALRAPIQSLEGLVSVVEAETGLRVKRPEFAPPLLRVVSARGVTSPAWVAELERVWASGGER